MSATDKRITFENYNIFFISEILLIPDCSISPYFSRGLEFLRPAAPLEVDKGIMCVSILQTLDNQSKCHDA